jgi:hypothetical protein
VPRRNRVTPLGELVADPARGLVFGNRGCLHDGDGRIRRPHVGRRWIACRLAFRGRRRGALMRPGRYTELFFLDDATAMAAGHRACAECRREDYRRLLGVWETLHPGETGAGAVDDRLHAERLDGDGRRRLHAAAAADLPDGTFVLLDSGPWLVSGGRALRWSPAGYGDRRRLRPSDRLDVVTPPSLVAVMRAGWEPAVPFLHPSAS